MNNIQGQPTANRVVYKNVVNDPSNIKGTFSVEGGVIGAGLGGITGLVIGILSLLHGGGNIGACLGETFGGVVAGGIAGTVIGNLFKPKKEKETTAEQYANALFHVENKVNKE